VRIKAYPQPDAFFPKGSPRRHVRSLYSVPVRFHYLMPGGVRTSRGITLDISEAGVGALVQGDLRVGETVKIDLPLSEHTLSAVAIVRHTSKVRCGFEFLGLTAEERQQITVATSHR
jgi:c-di-GMP-binding flagellar brake protein YcgR